MKTRFYLLLLFVLALASCRKDTEEISTTDVTYQPPVITVKGNLLGQVVGPNGTPIDGAQVWLGNQSVTTNEAGLFSFRDANLNAGGTYVRVEQAGYFHGSTRFFPRPNADNMVRIELLPRTIAGAISSASGGVVTLASGAKIELPANGVVDETGTAYTGIIEVAAQWLDPAANNLPNIMPGNLQGVNRNNQEVSMATFGMMAVELQSSDGRKLQVAPGKKAILSFPLSAEFRAQAPASIPLWYFDETLGLWVEEGQANLQGGMYVGEVSHFSFWNWDVPFPLVNITGTLSLNGSGVAANQLVKIYVEALNTTAYGYTDADGNFAGKVPKDEALTLQIWSACGVAASFNFGPLSADTNLGVINMNTTNELMTISGQLVDCQGDAISNGALLIEWGNRQSHLISPNADGSFNGDIIYCQSGDFTIKGYDLANGLRSDAETFTFAPNVAIGDFNVCDAPITEYMIVDVNGEEVYMVVSEMIDSIDSYGFSGVGTTSDGLIRTFTFWLPAALEEGASYTGNDLSVGGTDIGMGISRQYYCATPCDGATAILTEVGAPGEFINCTISGEVITWGNQGQVSIPITASFRIIRTQ